MAHGELVGGPVTLFGSDVSGKEPAVRCEDMMLSLLGTAAPAILRDWFAGLSDGGQVVDDLQTRPLGASDGQVIDRYGLRWLIGFEVGEKGLNTRGAAGFGAEPTPTDMPHVLVSSTPVEGHGMAGRDRHYHRVGGHRLDLDRRPDRAGGLTIRTRQGTVAEPDSWLVLTHDHLRDPDDFVTVSSGPPHLYAQAFNDAGRLLLEYRDGSRTATSRPRAWRSTRSRRRSSSGSSVAASSSATTHGPASRPDVPSGSPVGEQRLAQGTA